VHESGVHATIAGVLPAFAIPTRTRINAAEFSAKARGLLDYFDRTETGDLLVLTSKGQQKRLSDSSEPAKELPPHCFGWNTRCMAFQPSW
jgi:Na+/H+ antiporter NhaA